MTTEDVIETFDSMHAEIARDLDGATVHICVTDPDADYDDEVFVLYEKGGQLYEVHDSHCSCYGFENWMPEETTLATLHDRVRAWAAEGTAMYAAHYAPALRAWLATQPSRTA